MNAREIQSLAYLSKTDPVADPLAALQEQLSAGGYVYCLAYTHDDVLWGRVEGKNLVLSAHEFPEILPNLWEMRLFGPDQEWFLWKDGANWQSRSIKEGQGSAGDTFTERYILWGTEKAGQEKDGFFPVKESDLGIVHTPPIEFKERHHLRLVVRHYLDYDEAGAVFVKLSRLVNLENGGKA